ncbi:MAG: hypothetical protein ACLP8B_02585 [Xanthobacteraceae bacterium]|jgi:hypothetical protein
MDARILAVSGIMLLALSSPAAPQAPPALDGAPPPAPGGIVIGGQPPPAPTFQRCVDVDIGGDRGMGCLNQQLKREVDRVNPSSANPPLDARSPDVAVGLANSAAVREQYGQNYGRSVIPYRPPVPPVRATR